MMRLVFSGSTAKFRDESSPWSEREHAANWQITRGFGRVPIPVETTTQSASLIRYEHFATERRVLTG